jgi:hypothetical protein
MRRPPVRSMLVRECFAVSGRADVPKRFSSGMSWGFGVAPCRSPWVGWLGRSFEAGQAAFPGHHGCGVGSFPYAPSRAPV